VGMSFPSSKKNEIMETIFDSTISVWNTTKRDSANRQEMTIAEFMNLGVSYWPTINYLRQLYDYGLNVYATNPQASVEAFGRYNNEKSMLPLATIGGNFANGGKIDDLLEATNLMCTDIDTTKPHKAAQLMEQGKPVPNSQVTDWQRVKRQLSHLPWVCYCSLSIGGHGVFAIVRIDDYRHHTERWEAMKELLSATYGLTIDEATKDVTRARFVSYDDAPYINADALVFDKSLPKKSQSPSRSTGYKTNIPADTDASIMECVRQIQQRGIDITANYDDWIHIGAALYNHMGDRAEDIFVEISRYWPNSSEAESRKKFNKCKSLPKIGIGQFFAVCASYGIKYVDGMHHTSHKPFAAPSQPFQKSVIAEATPVGITPVTQAAKVQAKKCKIISLYIPSYSYMQDMSEEEWNEKLSPDAVARWQAANPVCPF